MADLSLPAQVNNNEDETSHISVDISTSETTIESKKSRRQRILHRVPPQLREGKNYIYDPVVLSIGPYHRSLCSEQFLQVEELKEEILINTIDTSTKDLFYSKILERIGEIRIFYGGLSVDKYKDEVLVEMMLRDACYLLYFMEATTGDSEKYAHLLGRLGLFTTVFLFRDYYLLENQIPLWVLRLLMTLKFDDRDVTGLLCKFLSVIRSGDPQGMTTLPWVGEEQEPLHILEADHTNLCSKGYVSNNIEHRGGVPKLIKWRQKRSTHHTPISAMINSPFRSVTYLKSKGIYCRPSSASLKDIRFNSYLFYGKLLLPICVVNNNTNVLFSNLVAFEMSPEVDTKCDVLAYVNFMKSLLKSPEDVKELREKGILLSTFNDDREVLKVFIEVDTYGMEYGSIFGGDVGMRISEHCNSKAKTWMAELIHTHFHSPWTTVAVFAASFLLCLTFLQTYYTMNPKNTN